MDVSAAERLADREAVESGQDDVKDHDLIRVQDRPIQRLLAVGHDIHGVAVRFQSAVDRIRDRRFVLDDEDPQSSPPSVR